jgi:acetolactate synthase I/II/III large subunit
MLAAVHCGAGARDDGHCARVQPPGRSKQVGLHEDGAVATVAEAYLSLLRDRGVSRLFVNAGTDFAPFVEAYARQKQSGLDFPELVVCAHENLAMSMAHGAYLGDGRVQAVMVHTSVGTANAVCGAFNAATDRVPILLAAGRTPLFEDSVLGSRDGGIHWAQEMYDQASMLREFVKWDYELRDGVHLAAVLDRAVDIAMTAPRGPVYLSLPREVLARGASGTVPPPASATPTDAAPSAEAVERLADLLAGARFPVFVTAASGTDPGTAALLGQLCDEYSIGVLESRPRCYNVSTSHPLHVGYDLAAVAPEADVLCFLDMDVPWIPAAGTPRADATVIQSGPDPHFSRYPVRTQRCDLSVTASTGNLLAALAAALPGRAGRIDRGRRAAIEKAAADSRSRAGERLAAAGRADGPITKAFMNWALAQVLPGDASVVSEYWARPELLPRRGPLSYFGTPPAGGLGWGLPAAIGLKLARPERTVISAVGDGAYMFANPAACHHAMAMHDIPVLAVVCANRKWTAVQGSALGMYPAGSAAAAGQLSPLAELGPAVAFEQYATASGGYGEAVTDRKDLVPALGRALHAVQAERRQAVLNVSCED